jgi:hypothetical protein
LLALCIQLKALRMALQWDIRDLAVTFGINQSERTRRSPDDDMAFLPDVFRRSFCVDGIGEISAFSLRQQD